jgi:hypothetical protein
MIEMLKRHEIQVLRRAGHTWKDVAALSGVAVRTVGASPRTAPL